MNLLLFSAVFLLAAVVMPMLRLKLRTGHSGFVAHDTPTPIHRIAVEGFRGATAALLAWPVLVTLLGAERLGVWQAPPWLAWLGSTLAAAALVLVVVAQSNMGPSWRIGIDRQPTALVTGGLFRCVRNPIFSAVQLMVVGVTLITPSPWTIMGLVFLSFVLALQVRLEEDHLLRLHGDDYRRYAGATGRFVPFVGRL